MDWVAGLKILALIICCLQEMHFIGNDADWGPMMDDHLSSNTCFKYAGIAKTPDKADIEP